MSESDLIVRIAARGDGVTADGRHVALSAPGDRLDPAGGLIFGPHHVAPPCRHFPICGGCQLQQLDEDSYAAFVRGRVVGALLGQQVEAGVVLPAIVSAPRTRRRASLRATKVGKAVHLGFSSEGSHRVVDMLECHILHPALFALVAPLRELFRPMVGERRGAQAHLTLIDQGIDLLVEGVGADGLKEAEALTAFAQRHGIARLSLDDGNGPETRWEPDQATITLGDVAVSFPPHGFLQATADGEQALVEAVRPALEGAKVWADLFAGVGTFAFGLGAGRKVYAAEAGRDLVLALKGAAGRAGRVVAADHRDLFRRPLSVEELERFDAVLIDPPRAGAREQVMRVARSKMPVLAYVSCNPASFARDAKLLIEGGYVLESVQPVGQFRWSTHVELAGIFRR